MKWFLGFLLALCLALSGCGRRHEFSIREELRPTTFKELVAMDREQLERVDIGRMNLLCADEASPDDDLDVEGLLGKLDEWANHCRREEIRFKGSFEKNPKRYDDSYAKFKAPDEYYLKSPIGTMEGMSAADIERVFHAASRQLGEPWHVYRDDGVLP